MSIEFPYKYLSYYDFADQNIFFGRESEINILVADILVNRLVVLFARTGTGKTSLINAGVRPRLETRGFRTFYIRVEKDPAEAARDILQKQGLLGEDSTKNPLSSQLISVVESLGKPIVLFFDQFEEFFIQIAELDRQKFIADISEVYQNAKSGVHLVFSMREEYFHMMDEFRTEIPSIFHKNSNLRLRPLNESQARSAIIGPVADSGVTYEPKLVDEIIQDLKQEKDNIRPPSLQIICDTLWRNKGKTSIEITSQQYNDLGGSQRILNDRLTRDIEKALADKDTRVIELFQDLIPKLKTEEDTKYPREIKDLVFLLNTDEDTLQPLIKSLLQVEVIKDIKISDAKAVEWASDYLAERTTDLIKIAKQIEIRRLWEQAVRASRDMRAATLEQGRKVYDLTDEEVSVIYLTRETFDKISEHIEYIPSQGLADSVLLLFDAALFHQQQLRRWFGQVAKHPYDPYEILRLKIRDNRTHIELGTGAIHLLADLKTDQAIALMGEALDKPDLALESIRFLVDIPGNQATDLLKQAVQREDLWRQSIQELERAGTMRSVALLEPLLQDEEKAFLVMDTLDRLARSERTQTSKSAKDLLVRTVTKFASEKAADNHVPYARDVLKRLAASTDGQVQSLAQRSLKDWETAPEIKREVKAVSQPRIAESFGESQSLRKIITLRNISKVVPVISNFYRLDQIFQSQPGFMERVAQRTSEDNDLTIKEQLTSLWAEKVNYPMPDDYDLARVAQYNEVEYDDSDVSKEKYLEFLSLFLLNLNMDKPGYENIVEDILQHSNSPKFSDIVKQLDYPEFPSGTEDPLRTLANLPLPVYITTSFYDFLERELMAAGKSPRSQLIFWKNQDYESAREFYPDPNFLPTPTQPVVYHLFGLENLPGSLVLSEEEHLQFLYSAASDFDTQNPIIPLKLRQALASSHLFFLGYDYQDWEFRTLFQFVLNYRRGETAKQGIFVHPPQKTRDIQAEEQLHSFLRHYFNLKRFDIEWKSTDQFIHELSSIWKNQPL